MNQSPQGFTISNQREGGRRLMPNNVGVGGYPTPHTHKFLIIRNLKKKKIKLWYSCCISQICSWRKWSGSFSRGSVSSISEAKQWTLSKNSFQNFSKQNNNNNINTLSVAFSTKGQCQIKNEVSVFQNMCINHRMSNFYLAYTIISLKTRFVWFLFFFTIYKC